MNSNNNNIIPFSSEKCHQAELIKGLKNIGYTDKEVNDALLFVENNPLETEVNNVIPFPQPEPMGVVIPFRKR